MSQNNTLLLRLAALQGRVGAEAAPDLTGGAPSLLRGNYDLSAFSKTPKAAAKIAAPMLESIFPGSGDRIADAALAEMLLELGCETDAKQYAQKAADAGALGAALTAKAQLLRLGVTVDAEGLDAVKARLAVKTGDVDAAAQWLSGCGLEDKEAISGGEFYLWLTKLAVLTAQKQFDDAVTLGESLLTQAQTQGRGFDVVEGRFLLALAKQGKGEDPKADAEQAVLTAQDYGFTRLFGDFGDDGVALVQQVLSAPPAGLRDAFAVSLRRALGLEPVVEEAAAEVPEVAEIAEVAEEILPAAEEAAAEDAPAEDSTEEETVEEDTAEEEAAAEDAPAEVEAPKSRKKKKS